MTAASTKLRSRPSKRPNRARRRIDRSSDDGTQFVFGYNAWASIMEGPSTYEALYQDPVTPAERKTKIAPSTKPVDVKDAIVHI